MWQRIRSLIVKEFLMLWKDRKSRFVLLVPPIIQLVLFASAANFEVNNVALGVWNEDVARPARELVSRFEGSGTFRITTAYDNPGAVERDIAVIVAEAGANLVTNLGTAGIGYINGDLTVSLARMPRSEFIGVQGDSHFSADGISIGSATLFDADGAFGTAAITALANPAAQIDFGGAPRVDAPGAEIFSGRRP